jgi:hypothetical protein
MPSAADIANIALSHLGARAQVNSITPPDGSVEAGYAARFYPIARRELIEAHAFAFTIRRATLAEVNNPSAIWTYAYALPTACIKPERVLRERVAAMWLLEYPDSTVDEVLTERGSADFEVEDGVLFTHEPEAVLKYRVDVTDTTRFPPLFTSTLGLLMAGYLAGPIIKGLDGAKVGNAWREQAFRMLAKAAASDANASSQPAEHVAAQIRARA